MDTPNWITPSTFPCLGLHVSGQSYHCSFKCNLGLKQAKSVPEIPKSFFLLPAHSRTLIFHVRRCIQKFPDWPPRARTANGKALCH